MSEPSVRRCSQVEPGHLVLLRLSFELAQRLETGTLELVDPPVLELVDRDRVEVVQLLPPSPEGADQVGGFEDGQMLGGRLARHLEAGAQLAKGLPLALVQPVEQIGLSRRWRCRPR
jgi:hypothetical protein